MKKILITGGFGMLGANLAKQALTMGHKVCIIDNLAKLDGYNNITWLKQYGNFTYHIIDIKDFTNLEEVFKTFLPDTVFHVAGQVAMTTSVKDPMRDFQTNAIGGFNVLECVRRYTPNACVLYSSTNKVYGDLDTIEYVELDTRFVAKGFSHGFNTCLPIHCSTPYGCSKGAADSYFLDYAKIYNLNTVVLRHSTIYGARQYANFDQGWVGWFCTQALLSTEDLQHTFTITGNGKQVRDILYISDAVDLYFTLVDNIAKVRGMAFNVGGGMDNSFSLLELLAFLNEHLGIRIHYECVAERQNDQKFFVCNFDDLTELTQWRPQVSKTDGVEQMIKWLKSL